MNKSKDDRLPKTAEELLRIKAAVKKAYSIFKRCDKLILVAIIDEKCKFCGERKLLCVFGHSGDSVAIGSDYFAHLCEGCKKFSLIDNEKEFRKGRIAFCPDCKSEFCIPLRF